MIKDKLIRYLKEGECPEFVPCGFWQHFPDNVKFGQKSIDAHVKYYRETQVSIIKIMNEHFYQLDNKIAVPKDWLDVKEKNIAESNYNDFLEEIKMLRKRMGEDTFILATIHGVLVSACHATNGPNHFTDPNNLITCHLKEDPDTVVNGLEKIATTLERLSLACLEAGADGIYYAALGGEKHRFSEELFNQYIKPLETRLLGNVMKEGIVFLHICKDNPNLPMYADYPAHVVNWAVYDSSYSMADGKRIFPDKIILGGFDNRSGVLLNGSEGEIIEKMKRIIQEVGSDKLIFGADCTLPETTTSAQIRLAVEASK